MRKAERFDSHYNLSPQKPALVLGELVDLVKQCRRCGVEFATRSRAKKRCDPCAEVVAARQQKAANERLQARRKAAKA